MKIGYARVSTIEQDAGFEAQLRDLTAAGCEKVFSEKISGTLKVRPELLAALAYMRPGDELVCTKLDRLARDLGHLLDIAKEIEAKQCGLIIVGMGIDTTTPVGKLVLSVLGAIAEFEVSGMKMRQAEGIKAAKALGKYKGSAGRSRKTRMSSPGQDRAKYVGDVLRYYAQKQEGSSKPKWTTDEIATLAGCSRRTVFRILEDAGLTGSRLPKEAANVE